MRHARDWLRPRHRPARLVRWLAPAAAVCCIGAAAALADPITYDVNLPVGVGSIVGQIQTSGNIGTLAMSDILGWNLTVNGNGASTVLTSTGGQSVFLLVGHDVTATATALSFNYSGTDTGYLAFQAANPGLYSGVKYWCNNTNWFGCSLGASAVPQVNTDPSAIYDTSYTGTRVIGTAQPQLSLDQLLASVLELSQARTAEMLINTLESQVMLGLNEQVSCGNCGGADASFGSFNLAAHGRYALSDNWTVFGGLDGGQYSEKGANVNFTTGFAAALQYDPGDGPSRPYASAGISASLQNVDYSRNYAVDNAVFTATGSSRGYDVGTYVQGGWVDRLTPRDEIAGSITLSRSWQIVNSYTERGGDSNPFSATIPGGTDSIDSLSLGGQLTHLFGNRIEADINGGVDWAFSNHSGVRAQVADMNVSGSQPAFVYYELGGRLGIRVERDVTIDLFVNSILASQSVGSSVHGGFGVRFDF